MARRARSIDSGDSVEEILSFGSVPAGFFGGPRHSRARVFARTRNLAISPSSISHMRFPASRRPGMTGHKSIPGLQLAKTLPGLAVETHELHLLDRNVIG